MFSSKSELNHLCSDVHVSHQAPPSSIKNIYTNICLNLLRQFCYPWQHMKHNCQCFQCLSESLVPVLDAALRYQEPNVSSQPFTERCKYSISLLEPGYGSLQPQLILILRSKKCPIPTEWLTHMLP